MSQSLHVATTDPELPSREEASLDPAARSGRGRAAALELLRPVGIYVASRAAVLTAMWLAVRLMPQLPPSHVFLSWDGSHYLRIIEGGYPDGSEIVPQYAFFPVFPLLARALAAVPGVGPLDAGLLVGGVAGVAAAVGIWVLARRLYDRAVADRAVALFGFFPGSFVLSMLYAEAVMLALSAACLWALVSRHWVLAGALAAVATASRPNAVALAAACGWACLVALWQRREWRSLAAPLLAPIGFLSFHVLLWTRTGDPFTWFRAQRELWHERVTPLALVDDVTVFVSAPFENTNTTAVVIGSAVALVGLVLMLRARVPGELVVFALVVLALAASSETLGLRPRFVLTAFPLFIGIAVHLRGAAFASVLGLFATVLGAFTMISLSGILFTP